MKKTLAALLLLVACACGGRDQHEREKHDERSARPHASPTPPLPLVAAPFGDPPPPVAPRPGESVEETLMREYRLISGLGAAMDPYRRGLPRSSVREISEEGADTTGARQLGVWMREYAPRVTALRDIAESVSPAEYDRLALMQANELARLCVSGVKDGTYPIAALQVPTIPDARNERGFFDGPTTLAYWSCAELDMVVSRGFKRR